MTESDQKLPTTEPIEATELNKIWQEYLQKCCEVGQIDHTVAQITGQLRDWEKKLEVAKRAVKSAASKHRELQAKQLGKPQEQAQTTDTTEVVTEAAGAH